MKNKKEKTATRISKNGFRNRDRNENAEKPKMVSGTRTEIKMLKKKNGFRNRDRKKNGFLIPFLFLAAS